MRHSWSEGPWVLLQQLIGLGARWKNLAALPAGELVFVVLKICLPPSTIFRKIDFSMFLRSVYHKNLLKIHLDMNINNKLPDFYENRLIENRVKIDLKTLVFTEIVTMSTITTTTTTTTTTHNICKPLVAKP